MNASTAAFLTSRAVDFADQAAAELRELTAGILGGTLTPAEVASMVDNIRDYHSDAAEVGGDVEVAWRGTGLPGLEAPAAAATAAIAQANISRIAAEACLALAAA